MTGMKVRSVPGIALGVNTVEVPARADFFRAVNGVAFYRYDPTAAATEQRTIYVVVGEDPDVAVPETAKSIGIFQTVSGPFAPAVNNYVFAE